ncbi:substrate-binding domain-containing protein [Oxyplasma meridianum]|uniref:Substrate-binding domain-containing protein n=1 Tax=Oxyplasma meridianum TaxID=3073602 RepID=A0AAX4NHV2_9ARCH
MRKSYALITAVLVAIVVTLSIAVFDSGLFGNNSDELITYSADAYVQETNYLLRGYHNVSGVNVEPDKGGGSYTDAREISQNDPANVFISVALNSYDRSYLGPRYSGWAIAFASDSLVIAYSAASEQNSSAASIIEQFHSAYTANSTALYKGAFMNLTSGKVKVGISNPNSDPAGFRAWISLEIAGYEYDNGNRSYFEIRMSQNRGNVSATSAADLVSPLLEGDIQFLYIYRSAAIAKGLHYISLPPELNFGNGGLASFYVQFNYTLATGVITGSPIYLYITALANNSNAASADGFVSYVVNNNNNLTKFGLIPLKTSILFTNVTVPSWLLPLQESGKLKIGGAID